MKKAARPVARIPIAKICEVCDWKFNVKITGLQSFFSGLEHLLSTKSSILIEVDNED